MVWFVECARKTFLEKSFLRWLFFLILICTSALICSKYFYQIMIVQGDSMQPTIHNMQFVIIDKNIQAYDIGDVIAFDSVGIDTLVVKRIVADEGDKVQIIGKKLYINNVVSELYKNTEFDYAGLLENEVVLDNDEYIVMGDNIEKSVDSRYSDIGVVNKKKIIGRVLFW